MERDTKLTQRRSPPILFEERRIARTLIGEEVAARILDLIGSGQLKPGDRLPSERELGQIFGVGRSSIREALRCLSIVGLLDARVGAGTTVALDSRQFLNRMWSWKIATDPRDLEELMEVRIALEGATAENAALNASEADIAALEDLLSQMGESLDDRPKFMELDLEFHLSLARAASNRLLHDLVMVIRTHLVRGLESVLPLPDALSLSHEEHNAIVKAVIAHDAERARRQMQGHLKAALLRYRNSEKQSYPAAV
jgi:GntR family transcriptional repressor for pyruvate dehydrogenase complex